MWDVGLGFWSKPWYSRWREMKYIFINDHNEENTKGSAEMEVVNYDGDEERTRLTSTSSLALKQVAKSMPKKLNMMLACQRKVNLHSQRAWTCQRSCDSSIQDRSCFGTCSSQRSGRLTYIVRSLSWCALCSSMPILIM